VATCRSTRMPSGRSDDDQLAEIRRAAARLVELLDRWLAPPDPVPPRRNGRGRREPVNDAFMSIVESAAGGFHELQ
jgi:hypothetical protein